MTSSRPPAHRVPLACLAVFAVVWVAAALRPSDREDWLLENLLTFATVPPAILTYRRFRFSDQAYVQATIFLVLHTIGSHYTYSEVPAGDWLRDALGLGRNHYDRVVHFCFGLLMLRPMRELCFRRPGAVGPVALAYLSFAAVAWWSVMYEVMEWIVAAIADPSAGIAYLGTQGDIWDAQKDMALASMGAAIAVAVDRWQLRSLK